MRVAVFGASGYTGLELLRIVLRHPKLELAVVTSEQREGVSVGEAFPALRGLVDLRFERANAASIASRVDVAFTALPHAASASVVGELRKAGVSVIDLSADFRLSDPSVYAEWYGQHGAPEIFGQAVYGMPELHREAIRKTDFVAAPGCYPTSVLIALTPFLKRSLVATAPILIDSKSGVSGAGRKLDATFLFAEIDGNCNAYKVGGTHRHVPEIEQEASAAAGKPVCVSFVPHLLPTIRGINTTIFLQPTKKLNTADALAVLQEAYANEPFVRVLPAGETPKLQSIRGSNFCDVSAVVDPRSGALILLSAIDNLVKGSGGQAVQCLNLMRGFDERTGLLEAPLVP